MSMQLALVLQGDVAHLSAEQINNYQQLLTQLGLSDASLSIIHINNKPAEPQYPYEAYAPLEEGIPDSMFLSNEGLCKAMSHCYCADELQQLYIDNKIRIEPDQKLRTVYLTQKQWLTNKAAA